MPREIYINRPVGADPKTPHCGVVAMAAFCSVSMDVVKETIRKHRDATYTRTNHSAWKGRTYHDDYVAVLNRHNKRRTAAFSIHRKVGRSITFPALWQFAASEARKDYVYLIITAGHAQLLQWFPDETGETPGDWWVMDQSGSFRISSYWGRRKKCSHAWAKKVKEWEE